MCLAELLHTRRTLCSPMALTELLQQQHAYLLKQLQQCLSTMYTAELLLLGAVMFAAAWLFWRVVNFASNFVRIERGLVSVPRAPGHNWLLGHVLPLLSCVKRGKAAWDLMDDWIKSHGPVARFRILGMHGVAVADPAALKRVFQTGQKLYEKVGGVEV
jgi:hypothetical protein